MMVESLGLVCVFCLFQVTCPLRKSFFIRLNRSAQKGIHCAFQMSGDRGACDDDFALNFNADIIL